MTAGGGANERSARGVVPVLYLHDHTEISGGETSLLLLWQHLDRRSFEPVLLAPAAGPLVDRARGLGIATYGVEFPRFRDVVTARWWTCVATVRRYARQLGAGILHGNAPATNLAAALAGRRANCRVVWHQRTLPLDGEWDVEPLIRWLPDRIICNSSAVARRFGGPVARVVVVYNGVPLERFFPGCGGARVRQELRLAPEEVAIGIVGNFSPVKRHDVFLRAAAIVGPRRAAARFFVVGGEVFEANRGRDAALRAEARRLGVEGRVAFLGRREDVPAVMDALDILVSTADPEACSRAILEAMASGTPVIGAAAGGTPELIVPEETGLLFRPGDADALAAALLRVIDDTRLRRAMGQAGRARAEAKFSVERQVRETEAVYASILGHAESG
jgi:glycosyltransferase involved in cell wall biosynthesis